MNPRPLARMRTRRAAIGLALTGLLGLAGCDPRSMFFFLQPFDPSVAATGPSLKGKRVVVLTHAVSSARADAPEVDKEVGRQVVAILREKVKHIEVVEPSKVRAWVEANPSWTDAGEAAKAFEADVAVYLEIQQFEIQSSISPGLFQGKASVHVQVVNFGPPKDSKGKPIHNLPKVSEPGFEDDCVVEFPKNGHLPMDSGVTRPTFKKKFLGLVASEVSWRFVEHGTGDDIQDMKFSN